MIISRWCLLVGAALCLLLWAMTSSSEVAASTPQTSSTPSSTNPKPKLNFTCLSDTHGVHNDEGFTIPEGDVLLFAGDAGLSSGPRLERFDQWLSTLPHRHKIVTLGNMDFIGEEANGIAGGRSTGCARLKHGHIVCDSIIEVEGYRIFASPWTPAFYGAYQLSSEEQAREHWSKLLPPDSQVDIIMTHGPPYGVADVTNGKHVGDKALLQAVQQLKTPPLLWVCGHIHGSYGQHVVPHPAFPQGEGITLINAAIAYLFDGQTGASPRQVELPGVKVTQPLLPQSHRKVQGATWKAPVDMHF